MKRFIVTLLAAITFSGMVVAQQPIGAVQPAPAEFPDVPEGHWAGDAIDLAVASGIIVGFPDGTYRGSQNVTRYEQAVIIARMINLFEGRLASVFGEVEPMMQAVEELRSELESMGMDGQSLSQALEGKADRSELEALREQVASLTAELEAMRSQMTDAGVQGPPGPQGPQGPEGPQGPAGPAGADGEAGEVAPPVVDEPEAPDAPDADMDAPEVMMDDDGPGPFSVRLGGMWELNDRVWGRLAIGYDDLIGPVGLRVTGDYGRQSPIDSGTVAVSGHLTYTLNFGNLGAYIGAGAGYQLNDVIGDPAPESNEGLFAGGLLGVEYALLGNIGLFIEGGADYYFDEVENNTNPDYDYDQIYPYVGGGVVFRF